MRKTTINQLFVYGTLAPGETNHHVLSDLAGDWRPATVKGTRYSEGWCGYPGVVLGQSGNVEGQVLTSDELSHHWQRLDEFEGCGYQRTRVLAHFANNLSSVVYIYALRHKPQR